MDSDLIRQGSTSVNDADSLVPELGSSKADLHERISSNGEVNGELGRAGEVLIRVELDLACSSEKLANLSLLLMHVATRESDFETFAANKENVAVDFVGKALEFDLLSGVFDSELKELDNFMVSLQTDIANARDGICSFKHLEETFLEMEEKLHDSEESLKQLQDQISEMRMQSAKLQRILSCLDADGNWNGAQGTDFLEDCQFLSMNAKIKMQTVEQQRHILRLLEKSLAREMDLEKKLTDSRQVEEEVKMRLFSSERDVYCMEEEATDAYERCFEAENAAEVLMGISKELLGRLHILQFNLKSLTQRETELRSKLEGSKEELDAKDSDLQKLGSSSARLNGFLVAQTESLKASLKETEDKLILSDSEAFTLREKVSSLEEQLKECENVVENLKEKVSKAENKADSAESKCKLLTETNVELSEELGLLKGRGINLDKVESLEKQLRHSDIQLQHAVASAEASEEKQKMLYSTISDMQNLIDDLKSKVLKAENRVDSTEEKLIILSESNAELNDELGFLRGRLICLEASLQQAEETKMETAKVINNRTKVMRNLVMQLAIEREHLHQQIAALSIEKNILVVKLQKRDKEPSIVTGHDNGMNAKEFSFPKDDLKTASSTREDEEVAKVSPASHELDERGKEQLTETEEPPADSRSELENVRRLDAGVLNLKHISIALLVLLISAAVYFLQQEECPF